MQVLENNFQPPEIISGDGKITCPYCNSVFTFNQNEMIYSYMYGEFYVDCPCCGKRIIIDENQNVVPAVGYFSFPKDFYHFSANISAIHISDQWIMNAIYQGINYLREHFDEHYYYTATGDTLVIVFRHSDDEEFNIIVSQDYYETELPFADEDF